MFYFSLFCATILTRTFGVPVRQTSLIQTQNAPFTSQRLLVERVEFRWPKKSHYHNISTVRFLQPPLWTAALSLFRNVPH